MYAVRMIVLLVLCSAFLHALWNALLKMQADKDVAGVVVIGVAELAALGAALAVWVTTARAPFPDQASIAWSTAAGVFEAGYFLTLIRALERAPLGVAYTVSRGIAILTVWPISVLWLDEPVTTLAITGTALLGAGLVASGIEKSVPRHALGLAIVCGLLIAGYHLCYKQAMATGAQATAVFAVSLGIAFPLNAARLGRTRLPELFAKTRARPFTLFGLGIVCGASFLLFLVALAQSGAGFVLTLRNTSIVFAALLGWAIGDAPSHRQITGAVLVAGGAILLGLSH